MTRWEKNLSEGINYVQVLKKTGQSVGTSLYQIKH